jgi:hypothetical protein
MDMARTTTAIAALCLLASLAGVVQAGDMRLYRYKDLNGNLVLSYAIPGDRVAGGYQVIDAGTGRVLETVPAQLSPEQLAARQAREQARAACMADLERVQTLYSSEREIDRALEEALHSIDGRIKNAEANLTQLRGEQRKLEKEAAQLERTGGALSEMLVGNIERTQTQIETLEAEVVQRHSDKETARARFAEDLAIFKRGRCPDWVANN